MQNKAHIETRHYVNSHSKAPRGFGYWAFALSSNAPHNEIFWHHGNYAEAQAAARKHFAGAIEIVVLP